MIPVIETPHHYSTFKAAQLLGVDMTSVMKWCNQGRLSAYKTPGGHRRIKALDLVSFLKENHMPIPPTLKQTAMLKCLVVDDDAPTRDIVTRLIKEIDREIQVEEAADGFEAGKKVMEFLPQLVVLDLNLPGIDGFKVCESIRKDERFKQTKILAITGLSPSDSEKRILAAGANEFLSKPFKNPDLKEKLSRLIGAADTIGVRKRTE